MFNPCNTDEQGKEEGTPLKLAEPIAVIELFLTHLDPSMPTPPIDPKSVEGLLTMADKYQANMIMRWFEQEVNTRRENKMTGAVQEALVVSNPALVLSLAIQFRLQEIGQWVLREVSGCHVRHLAACPNSLHISVLMAVHRLRDLRIKRYHGWIDILASKPSRAPIRTSRSKTTDFDHSTSQSGRRMDFDDQLYYASEQMARPRRSHAPEPTSVVAACSCTPLRARWIMGMMKAVQASPQWTTFEGAYNISYKCQACNMSNCDEFRNCLPAWKKEAMTDEEKIPDWPF